jgi:hypothetical protein
MKTNLLKTIFNAFLFVFSLGSQAQFISGGAGKTVLQNINDNVGIGTNQPGLCY